MKEIKRIILPIIFTIMIGTLIYVFFNMVNKSDIKLVINGYNTRFDKEPYVENDIVFLTFDTIFKNIDDEIFYDDVTKKIIITDYLNYIKLELNQKKILHNLEEKEIANAAILKNKTVYIPINEFKDIYNIDINYNESQNVITIDKKDNITTAKIAVNNLEVYSNTYGIKNNILSEEESFIIDYLDKDEIVTMYPEVLKHNRLYKIKTSDNIVGYVEKNAIVDIVNKKEEVKEEIKQDKVIMYWQLDASTYTLTKETGVNVVSPRAYDLKNSNGDIDKKDLRGYINEAKSYGYEVWPHIINGFDSSNFTATTTSNMVNSESTRENFIRNLIRILKEDNVDGINLDFEMMKAEDKDMFTQLVKELAPMVRSIDKKISIDMYFVDYLDRKNIGEAVDYTILMGYDQHGKWSSESGSVSEIPWVEKNINSLISDSNISAEKIILGVPFYTRFWIEQEGKVKPTVLTWPMNLVDRYLDYHIPVSRQIKQYDEISMQNYIEYTSGKLTKKIWLEDETSMKNRVDLINKYKMAGLAAWRKGQETYNIWSIIDQNLERW